MATTNFRSVDEYIAAQPKHVQPALRQVRRIIRKAVPAAEERISYQMPAYRVPAGGFLYFGGWKEHFSLYPASDKLVAAFKGALTRHRVSKGTLRFPLSEPVPAKLIERIAKFQAGDAARRAKARAERRARAKSR